MKKQALLSESLHVLQRLQPYGWPATTFTRPKVPPKPCQSLV